MSALHPCSMTEGQEPGPIDASGAMIIASKKVVEDSEGGLSRQLNALEIQQVFWRAYHRNSPTWAFFTINDSSPVDLVKPQLMRCIVCHPSRRETLGQRSTRCRKGVVLYNKEHGTSAMKRHVHAEHPQVFSSYKAQRSSFEPSLIEARQLCKKRPGPTQGTISSFFNSLASYDKNDEQQQQFLEDLALYIAKDSRPLYCVESKWLRRLVLRQCPRVVFPSHHELVDEVIPQMVTKTMEKHIHPSLAGCLTATASFDLWFSRAGRDTYAFVINFINDSWIPCHVTLGLFETSGTSDAPVAVQLEDILCRYNLRSRILAYVKDEGAFMDNMAAALTSMVSCEPLDLAVPYAGTCFGHAMSQCCLHATNDTKVCAGFKTFTLKDAQTALQKSITWTKKSKKERQEWAKACTDCMLPPRVLKTPVKTRFASKVVLFHEILEYKEAITTCYLKQDMVAQLPLPSLQTWAIARTVSESLIPVVRQCVLNQSCGYWFLSDALSAALSLSIELRQDRWMASNVATSVGNDSFDEELLLFKSRMREEVLGVLEPLLSFAETFSRQKAHNMLVLMLDPRFKGLGLVRDYVGADKVVGIVFEYDMQVLLPLLMQCFKRLHPAAKCHEPVTPVSENSIFGAQASAEEVILGQLKSELSLFRRLHVADGGSIGPLVWWKEHEKEFPIVGFLARQLLGIVGSRAEIERIFSIGGVITSLRQGKLGIDNLEKLVLICKNWPDDVRHDGKLEETSVTHFLAVEDSLIDDNVHLIEEAGLFEE